MYSFGGYANQQLRRLSNKAARVVGQEEREQHILNSIMNAVYTFPSKYAYYPEDSLKLYIDKSDKEDYNTEIFMDMNFKHYPLRDYKAKHMMHLVRLYYMCFDILENEKIVTYRGKEHDLLMDIRNGKYLDGNDQPIPEFYELVDELDKRLAYDKKNTSLPENPDYNAVNEFMASVNERVVKGE